MATKKKITKKSTKSKRTTGRKVTPAKKLAQTRKTAKKSAKRKVPTKALVKTKGVVKKTISRKTAGARVKATGRESRARDVLGFSPEAPGSRSGEWSGDIQGLSNVERADSESVDELIEEGNPFEAGVVSGVEDAGDHDEREVRTREVPEDDVPREYLDKD